MIDVSVNYLAVLVAAVGSMVLGGLWYGSKTFGSIWMADNGGKMSPGKLGLPGAYGLMFLASLIIAYITAHMAFYVATITVKDALQLAIWLWLGYVALTGLNGALFSGRYRAWMVDAGYWLVNLSVMSCIVTLWI